METKTPIKVTFREWECILQTKLFQDKSICLQLIDVEDGSPVARATVAMNSIHIPDILRMALDEAAKDGIIYVAVKDYSENEGMLKALITAKIVGPPTATVQVGFAEVHLCPLLIKL